MSVVQSDAQSNSNGGIIIYSCPHCGDMIITQLDELNCCIFRHGFNFKTGQQIPQHASEAECQALSNNKDIIGCCKPYEIIKINSNYIAQICTYK